MFPSHSTGHKHRLAVSAPQNRSCVRLPLLSRLASQAHILYYIIILYYSGSKNPQWPAPPPNDRHRQLAGSVCLNKIKQRCCFFFIPDRFSHFSLSGAIGFSWVVSTNYYSLFLSMCSLSMCLPFPTGPLGFFSGPHESSGSVGGGLSNMGLGNPTGLSGTWQGLTFTISVSIIGGQVRGFPLVL